MGRHENSDQLRRVLKTLHLENSWKLNQRTLPRTLSLGNPALPFQPDFPSQFLLDVVSAQFDDAFCLTLVLVLFTFFYYIILIWNNHHMDNSTDRTPWWPRTHHVARTNLKLMVIICPQFHKCSLQRWRGAVSLGRISSGSLYRSTWKLPKLRVSVVFF